MVSKAINIFTLGWVDPYEQYPAYATFSYENKLISEISYYALKVAFAACQVLIKTGIWPIAFYECQLSVITLYLNFSLLPSLVQELLLLPPSTFTISEKNAKFHPSAMTLAI